MEKNSADFKLQGEMIRLNDSLESVVDGKRHFRLQVIRNRIDANFDWLTLETPQEEETFGRTGLVVECVFDFVSSPSLSLSNRTDGRIYHFGMVLSGFLLLVIQQVKRGLDGEREVGSHCEFELTN